MSDAISPIRTRIAAGDIRTAVRGRPVSRAQLADLDMAPDPVEAANQLARQLSAVTYTFGNERELQDAIWRRLEVSFGALAQREVILSQADRPDFVVEVSGHRVAVEVKIRGARPAIMRQIGRYAAHPTIDAIVFASARRTLLAGFPAEIHGKPIAVALVAGPL